MSDFNPHPKPAKTKKKTRVRAWNDIRSKVVKPVFKKLKITYCEVTSYLYSSGSISDAQAFQRNSNLSFHHRHKRVWYKQFDRKIEEKLLGDYNQVILVGQYYHDQLEHNKELTERWFMELRGKEINDN